MKSFGNANIYIDGEGIKNTSLIFNNEIVSIGENTAKTQVLPLPKDAIVLPGFIDTHMHGAGGGDAMDGKIEALATIDKTLAKEGTTRFLATTMTQSEENILHALTTIAQYRKGKNGLLGIHLEGPFISPAYIGAQPSEYVLEPNFKLFEKFNAASNNNISIVTVAPEREGAIDFIRKIKELGVSLSLGHTSAKFADIQSAVKVGANSITHTFNAQLGIHHREIGTAGAALLFDELYTEIIADGKHISFDAIKLLKKCKPKDKIILITDAMRAKGQGDGESELGGQTVFVKNGEARLKDGTLAGSVLKMNDAVKNLVKYADFTIEEAVDCAAKNPATRLGLKNLGAIKTGNIADFTIIDKNFTVLYAIRYGEIIYKQ